MGAGVKSRPQFLLENPVLGAVDLETPDTLDRDVAEVFSTVLETALFVSVAGHELESGDKVVIGGTVRLTLARDSLGDSQAGYHAAAGELRFRSEGVFLAIRTLDERDGKELAFRGTDETGGFVAVDGLHLLSRLAWVVGLGAPLTLTVYPAMPGGQVLFDRFSYSLLFSCP